MSSYLHRAIRELEVKHRMFFFSVTCCTLIVMAWFSDYLNVDTDAANDPGGLGRGNERRVLLGAEGSTQRVAAVQHPSGLLRLELGKLTTRRLLPRRLDRVLLLYTTGMRVGMERKEFLLGSSEKKRLKTLAGRAAQEVRRRKQRWRDIIICTIHRHARYQPQ